jgi:DMSO/TMAO reductase YedYZ molybdopterin-dependent catalytic subunit
MSETAAVGVSMEELQLAARNHGMPLEALRYPVTPIGLHYLLTHYDIPDVDAASWRLHVDGHVERPVELSLSDLRAMPTTTRTVTMECAGNGRALLADHPASQPWLVEAVGTGEWTGVELAHVLATVRPRPAAVEALFTGADRGFDGGIEQQYQRSLTLTDATRCGALLAFELNGAPLPPQHGAPLRLVVPGWYGMANVKWLTDVTLIDAPFTGYQQATAYRLRTSADEEGTPVTRMAPRSLMVPPGIPDFLTRRRTVPAGSCSLTGRAWSGWASIESVDVSADGGSTWWAAELDVAGRTAGTWVGWRAEWAAAVGEHELCCRATDAAGNIQPLQGEWNTGGYVNNSVHRVPVEVVVG